MAGKICDVCRVQRPKHRFRTIKRPGTDDRVYLGVCKACEAKQTAEKLKKQVAARKAEKEHKKYMDPPKSYRQMADEMTPECARDYIEKHKNATDLTPKQQQLLRAAYFKLKDANEATDMTPEEREFASRQLMRRKLLPFIRKFNKNYRAGWVHKDICLRLERFVRDVEAEKGPRLMLFMPPRHGKSEIASKNFPAWVLGQHPEWEIIASSYAVSLPIAFSRKVQGLLADPYYSVLFPDTKLHPKAQAADAWMTDRYEGGYIAAGVGTGISGKGAHILIIDDPVKDAEEADSATQREKVWDWWGCWSPDTEIHTSRGWIPVSEVRERDIATTLNPKTRQLGTNEVTEVFEYDFDGDMVEVEQRQGVSFSVTPNHTVWVSQTKGGELKPYRADKLPPKCYIPRGARSFVGQNPYSLDGFPAEAYMRFLGMYLGDGSTDYPRRNTVRIATCIDRKHQYAIAAMEDLGVDWFEVGTEYVAFTDKALCETLPHGCDNKYIPKDLLGTLDQSLLQPLFEGLMATDGHKVRDGRYRYTTASKQLCDDLCVLGTKLGYAVSFSVRHPSGKGKKVVYNLSLRKAEGSLIDQRDKRSAKQVSNTPYKGKVYCCTVPPHHIVLIRRNGRVSWSGQSTAKTRLAPGGGVLVIQTRWHDDDLAGRLLSQQKNLEKEFATLIEEADDPILKNQYRKQLEEEVDRWEVIEYPAEAEHDEYLDLTDNQIRDHATENCVFLRPAKAALHPDRFPIHRLRNMKRSMQPRHWSALYQQKPVPDEGAYFTKDMIRFSSPGSVPPHSEMKLFSAWDLAVGQKETNDYSVGVVGGLDWQGNIHILDMIRLRGDTHTVAEAIISMYKRFPSIQEIGIERGQLELAIRPQLKILMKKHKVYPTFSNELKPITDKPMRARPLQGRMQQGVVMFPAEQAWTELAVHELLRFPGGAHDDIVDALAWLSRMLIDVQEPVKPGAKKHKSWRDRLNEIQQPGGNTRKGYMNA